MISEISLDIFEEMIQEGLVFQDQAKTQVVRILIDSITSVFKLGDMIVGFDDHMRPYYWYA